MVSPKLPLLLLPAASTPPVRLLCTALLLLLLLCLWPCQLLLLPLSPTASSSLLPAAKKSLEAVKRDFSDIILPGNLHDRVRSLYEQVRFKKSSRPASANSKAPKRRFRSRSGRSMNTASA